MLSWGPNEIFSTIKEICALIHLSVVNYHLLGLSTHTGKQTSSKLNFGHHHSLPCWYGYCHYHFQLLSVGNIKQQCSHGRGCKFSAISPSSHPPPCAICQAPLTVIPLHQSVIKCRVGTQRQKNIFFGSQRRIRIFARKGDIFLYFAIL